MLKLLILIATGSLFIVVSSAKKPAPSSKCFEEAMRVIIPSNFAFNGKLLKALIKVHPSENFMYSSPVTWYLLAQVGGLSAHGDAHTQIMKTMNFKNEELVKCFFERIIPIILNLPDVEFRLIAKIYSDATCPLTNEFKKQTKEEFVFEPTNLDFQDPDSAKFINQEVAKYTNNRIVDFIKPKSLMELSGLVLVSAIYFQGQWQKPFDPKYTRERDFHVSKYKTIKVKTMYQKNTFLYAESSILSAKILRMKYVGTDFTLVIMLPNCIDGLDDVVDKIRDPDLIMSALDSLEMKPMKIYLPAFNITVANRLKEPVKSTNVTKIFCNATAGLEDITSCSGTYVSDILQKLTLQVDEGVGHNKTTDLETEDSCKEDNESSYTFRANRPFLYYLFYHNFVVFTGIFYH